MRFQGLDLKVGDKIKCIARNTQYESCIDHGGIYSITEISDHRIYITCKLGERHWLTDSGDYIFVKFYGTEKKDYSYLFKDA
jgi:hypothetical protein